MQLLVLVGIFVCPVFTLGCVLIHYDREMLGLTALFVSIFLNDK